MNFCFNFCIFLDNCYVIFCKNCSNFGLEKTFHRHLKQLSDDEKRIAAL